MGELEETIRYKKMGRFLTELETNSAKMKQKRESKFGSDRW